MGSYGQLTDKIIKLRKDSGYTQQQIAEKLGLSRQRWILVEKGERDLNTEELEILANLFGINVSDFFQETANLEKFRQMFFACLKYGASAHGIPKTKLAKLLYLADFANYFNELEPMSGVKYRRMEYGPVPDVFFSMTDDLLEQGKIGIEILDRGAQMVSLKSRDVSDDQLSDSEKDLIKKVCESWKERPTEEIVNFTHEQLPWKMCRDGEFIPYSLIIQEDPQHVYLPASR
jgi:transcriptional regulator with XRE-family HTH domain